MSGAAREHHTGTPRLESPRLVLRRFTVGDAEAMYQGWATDPEVTRWMRWAPHPNVEFTRALLAEWVKAYDDPAYYHWALERKEDGRLIGSLGILRDVAPAEGLIGWEPGYCIARPFWNRGYTSEALQTALDWFTRATGVKHLICCHAVENPASGRVMQKAGFVYDHEGHYCRLDGSQVPALHYVYREGEP